MCQLSVIIPVYNVSEYLYNNLSALHNVNNAGIEFIIVNDGSTDSSYEICAVFEKIDKRFKIINKSNGGVSSARNVGLDIATGKYVFFLDGDDIILPGFNEIITECMQSDLNFVFFNRWYKERNCLEYKYNIQSKLFERYNECIYRVLDVAGVLKGKCFCSGSGEVLLKRNIITTIRFDTNRSLLEDYDFFLKVLFSTGTEVFYYNKAIMMINDNVPNSLTKSIIPFRLNKFLVETNPFFRSNKSIVKQYYWLEAYFNIRKITPMSRLKYFMAVIKKDKLYVSINKYFLGCLFFALGIDINKFRVRVIKLLK